MTTDIEAAAERVRAFKAHPSYPHTGGHYAAFQRTLALDQHKLADAYLAQSPSYADLTRQVAELTAERDAARAEAESFRAQHAELNAELLDLARRYDPNCDVYDHAEQAAAMDAARQTVEAMQELAEYLGRDPEGCLVDCADEAMERIETANEENDELLTYCINALHDTRNAINDYHMDRTSLNHDIVCHVAGRLNILPESLSAIAKRVASKQSQVATLTAELAEESAHYKLACEQRDAAEARLAKQLVENPKPKPDPIAYVAAELRRSAAEVFTFSAVELGVLAGMLEGTQT